LAHFLSILVVFMDNDVFLQRAGRIAGVGGWRVDLSTMKVEWSKKTCEILEYPDHYQPSLEEAISLYKDDSKRVIGSLVERAILDGTSYDIELPVQTRTGKTKWVRSVGEIEYENGVAVALAGAFQDISERKLADLQIARSVEETKTYYDNAPCGYYSLGPDRTIVRANDRLLAWFGESRDSVIGQRKPTDFMTADSLEPAISAFRHLKDYGEFIGLECELLPVNGVSRHVSISAKAVFDDEGTFLHTSSVMYDISELVRQRARADKVTADLFAMIDNDLVGTFILRNRKFIWANKAMHRMFGYDEGELVGFESRAAYKDEQTYQRVGLEAYEAMKHGAAYKREIEMMRRDGTSIWVHLHGMLLQNSDGDSMWMMSDVTELKHVSAQKEYLANHDVLTGLPNRRAFSDLSQITLAKAESQSRKVVFCVVDLDGFKSVNDRLGHAAGDQILKTVTKRLENCFRKSDHLFRLGGDEFAIILSDVEHVSEVEAILSRALVELSLPIHVGDGAEASISGSIGASVFPEDSRDHSDLLTKADKAMYAAKRSGKNALVFYHGIPAIH